MADGSRGSDTGLTIGRAVEHWRQRAERAEAALERVRALAERWRGDIYRVADQCAREVLAILNGTASAGLRTELRALAQRWRTQRLQGAHHDAREAERLACAAEVIALLGDTTLLNTMGDVEVPADA